MKANLESISHKCYLFGVAFVWEMAATVHRVRGNGSNVVALGAINPTEREFFTDNLLVRIHLIIEMVLVDRPRATGV